MSDTFPSTVRFVLDGFHIRRAIDWANSGVTPREHAETYGYAGSWKSNGSFVTCTKEHDAIVRRNFAQGVPIPREEIREAPMGLHGTKIVDFTPPLTVTCIGPKTAVIMIVDAGKPHFWELRPGSAITFTLPYVMSIMGTVELTPGEPV